jgi:hypothetical protein
LKESSLNHTNLASVPITEGLFFLEIMVAWFYHKCFQAPMLGMKILLRRRPKAPLLSPSDSFKAEFQVAQFSVASINSAPFLRLEEYIPNIFNFYPTCVLF